MIKLKTLPINFMSRGITSVSYNFIPCQKVEQMEGIDFFFHLKRGK